MLNVQKLMNEYKRQTVESVNGFTTKAGAMRALNDAGFSMAGLLAAAESNPKLAKNGLQGVYAKPLHLAPASLSGFNLCAMASAGCIAACLHTAGNPVYMPQKTLSRIAKSKAYMTQRKAFMALLTFEIALTVRQAEKKRMQPAIRLNATSDIPFESVAVEIDGIKYANLFTAFPNVEFYDYTAIPKRALKFARGQFPANYHLTFSRKENNDSACHEVLNAGGNVAIVFGSKDTATQESIARAHGFNAPLVNADLHDFRPLDGKGVIAALYAKGDAKTDESGFVLYGKD